MLSHWEKKKTKPPPQTNLETKSQAQGKRRWLQSSPLKSETLCLEIMILYVTLLQRCPHEAWLCSWSVVYSIAYTNFGFCPISPKVISVYLRILCLSISSLSVLLKNHTAPRFTGEHLLIWLKVLKQKDWPNPPSPSHRLLGELPTLTNERFGKGN